MTKLLIFALLLWVAYKFVWTPFWKKWNEVDVDAQIEELESTESQFEKVNKAKEVHKNIGEKKEVVRNFKKGK